MLVYSKSLGEKTGNLAVNQYQFGYADAGA